MRFALPAGVGPEELRSAVEGEIDVSGNQVSVRTEHPQKTLYKLTGWAERKGIELEAERPSLEDIFLELTGDGASGGAPGGGEPAPGGHRDV